MTSGITLQTQSPASAGADLGFRLATLINGQPMAMRERELALMVEAIAANRFTLPRNRKTGARITENGTAIVEIHGLLIDRAPILGSVGWLTVYEGLGEQFRRLATHDQVKRIVLDLDTPGGMVAGIQGCADELIRLAEKKPVFAIAHNMACSAGYWLACIAQEVSVTPDGEVGSIGVRAGHVSYAEALDRDGISVTIFKAGATKADLSPYSLLDPGAAAEEQHGIDRAYDKFCAHVAAHRPLSDDDVRETDARTFIGERAIEAKLADRVESLEQLIERVEKDAPKVKRPKKRAATVPGSTAGPRPLERQPELPDEDQPSAGSQTQRRKGKLMDEHEAAEANDLADLITQTLVQYRSGNGKPVASAAQPAPAPAQPQQTAAADTQAQISAAVDAAMGRVFAVLESDEAKSRPKMAIALAKSGLPAEAAIAILTAAPQEQAGAAGDAQAAALGNALNQQMQRPGNAAHVKPDAPNDPAAKKSFSALCGDTATKKRA